MSHNFLCRQVPILFALFELLEPNMANRRMDLSQPNWDWATHEKKKCLLARMQRKKVDNSNTADKGVKKNTLQGFNSTSTFLGEKKHRSQRNNKHDGLLAHVRPYTTGAKCQHKQKAMLRWARCAVWSSKHAWSILFLWKSQS